MTTPAQIHVARDDSRPRGWLTVKEPATDLRSLSEQLRFFSDAGWLCRGEARKFTDHRAPLGRLIDMSLPVSKHVENECCLVDDFVTKSYSILQPYERTFLDTFCNKLVLMQHHRVPTRLLDWTRSPWIALYFAVCDPDAVDVPGQIWAFNGRAVSDSVSPDSVRAASAALRVSDTEEWRATMPKSPEFVSSFGVYECTPRMLAQQSEFTFASHLNIDHMAFIGKHSPELSAIVIPVEGRDLKRAAMRLLKSMNIHAATLFPGIDGVGQSVREDFLWALPTLLRRPARGARDSQDENAGPPDATGS